MTTDAAVQRVTLVHSYSNQLDRVVDSHRPDLHGLRVHADGATVMLIDRLQDRHVLGQVSLSKRSHHTSLSRLFHLQHHLTYAQDLTHPCVLDETLRAIGIDDEVRAKATAFDATVRHRFPQASMVDVIRIWISPMSKNVPGGETLSKTKSRSDTPSTVGTKPSNATMARDGDMAQTSCSCAAEAPR